MCELNSYNKYSISLSTSDWANFGSYVGGTISPILAFGSFVGLLLALKEQRRDIETSKTLQDAMAYYEQGIKCLERAFNEISDNGKLDKPKQDRLAWLTTARLILTSYEFYAAIPSSVKSYKRLYESEAEDWRKRFYTLFDVIGTQSFSMDKSYFSNPKITTGEIEERSIKVIYGFIDWPENQSDPISKVQRYTDAEIQKLHVSQHGLKTFLLEKRQRKK